MDLGVQFNSWLEGPDVEIIVTRMVLECRAEIKVNEAPDSSKTKVTNQPSAVSVKLCLLAFHLRFQTIFTSPCLEFLFCVVLFYRRSTVFWAQY